MGLIDKADIISEIERRIKELEPFKTEDNFRAHGAIAGYYQILSFIRSLETKEVDLDNELDFVKDAYYYFTSDERSSMKKVAKHFFELGLKASDWRQERMKECPYRQVGCTMYSGTILECRGACSWVVDYPKLKELEEKKGE